MRIGSGYDVHRLVPGRAMVLCGVSIPCDFGPEGHSDADAPVHALIDALLGATALGDIGQLFPDTDMRLRGADSVELLKIAYTRVTGAGYRLVNADITVVLQAPKLAPYIGDMRRCLADALGVPVDAVSVKATTEERLGFTGSGEGVAAGAVVLVE